MKKTVNEIKEVMSRMNEENEPSRGTFKDSTDLWVEMEPRDGYDGQYSLGDKLSITLQPDTGAWNPYEVIVSGKDRYTGKEYGVHLIGVDDLTINIQGGIEIETFVYVLLRTLDKITAKRHMFESVRIKHKLYDV